MEDGPVTSLVKRLLSAERPISAEKVADVVDVVHRLEQDAKASVVAAAKYNRRKAADVARKRKAKLSAEKPIDTPISKLGILDSESAKKVRKTPQSKKQNGDLFDGTAAMPPDDWPADYAIQFWDAWPRHNRKYGQRQVANKLAVVRRSSLVTWATLIGGLRAYLGSSPDPKFIPAPLVWLNQSRWTADYSVVSAPKKGFGYFMRGGKAANGQ